MRRACVAVLDARLARSDDGLSLILGSLGSAVNRWGGRLFRRGHRRQLARLERVEHSPPDAGDPPDRPAGNAASPSGSTVRLVEVDADNWRDLVEVAPLPEQERFVAPISRYLALAHYGGEWHPLAIESERKVVGHVMWAQDDDGSIWLGGLVIDAASQRRGIGRATVEAFVDRFTAPDGSVHVALSYEPDNIVARDLYRSLGFEETGEMAETEVVARLKRGADRSRSADPHSHG
jgi:diamine N-acetyltransferase